ncbi:MAG: acetoin utilization protein AcuC [Gammaproteobacteria bacterium]|nr:acetoin utilization protein AcuC [Gammaproteobacteria bacterium]
MSNPAPVVVVAGEAIARYGFGEGHPFGPDRHDHFLRELHNQGLAGQVVLRAPRAALTDELLAFHTPAHLERVRRRSASGEGYLDGGDTPAFPGVFEAASAVVGATLVAVEALMDGECRRAFVPIAGLHHAGRDHAAGFCAFNDCGVAVEILRARHGLRRIAYVDIDAHHGDGVYYAFQDDAELIIADLHEDGRFLYPGTGTRAETGRGAAAGTKLNLPLPPGARDEQFHAAWAEVEAFLERHPSEFILFQCGADSLAGDPITHLELTEAAHRHAASRLCEIAAAQGHGRVLGMGGGGYDRRNLARAWTGVVRAFVDSPADGASATIGG